MSARAWRRGVLPLALGLTCACAHAVDWNASVYGSLGLAASDRPYHFERVVDSNGTFMRDSILGAQLDAAVSPQWSATVQLTLAPSLQHDGHWALQDAWSFVSWRPDNDWLLRLGKQRAPFYLNAENRQVGQTYAQARLPAEVYAISPTTDFTGVSLLRTWLSGADEWGGEVYGGRAHVAQRSYSSDLGAQFMNVRVDLLGLSLSWRNPRSIWRAGLIHAQIGLEDGQLLPRRFPWVNLGSGVGYYQISDAMPGPGVPMTSTVLNDILQLGVDTELEPSWHLVLEGARNVQQRSDIGDNTLGASITLLHDVGRWTPYVGLARLRTVGAEADVAAALLNAAGNAQTPLAVAQRVAAQTMPIFDQSTLSLGAAWSVDAHSRIKMEWAQTDIARGSSMVDAPAGTRIAHTRVQVLSLSYSFAY